MTHKHLFATFDVTRQVFYRSSLSMAIVNLKPLLPGHVLVCPNRVVPRLADLQPSEVSDLFLAVQRVGSVLEQAYRAGALTVSLQDGAIAGQSVPHVHVHIIPRHTEDYGGENDRIYPLLEQSEGRLNEDLGAAGVPRINGDADNHEGERVWPKDEDRRPRSLEEMEREADWLAGFFQ